MLRARQRGQLPGHRCTTFKHPVKPGLVAPLQTNITVMDCSIMWQIRMLNIDNSVARWLSQVQV